MGSRGSMSCLEVQGRMESEGAPWMGLLGNGAEKGVQIIQCQQFDLRAMRLLGKVQCEAKLHPIVPYLSSTEYRQRSGPA